MWHYAVGTDNPIETMIPNTAAGLAMANMHVSEIVKGLEERIGEDDQKMINQG